MEAIGAATTIGAGPVRYHVPARAPQRLPDVELTGNNVETVDPAQTRKNQAVVGEALVQPTVGRGDASVLGSLYGARGQPVIPQVPGRHVDVYV